MFDFHNKLLSEVNVPQLTTPLVGNTAGAHRWRQSVGATLYGQILARTPQQNIALCW